MSVRRLQKETVRKKGLNLTFPLRRGTSDAFEVNTTTLDAVKDDLRVLLLTNQGERLVHYTFGANLRALLFENQSQEFESKISDSIISAVERWMPFVSVNNIEIKTGQQNLNLAPNEVSIKIFFGINNTELDDTLEVIMKS